MKSKFVLRGQVGQRDPIPMPNGTHSPVVLEEAMDPAIQLTKIEEIRRL